MTGIGIFFIVTGFVAGVCVISDNPKWDGYRWFFAGYVVLALVMILVAAVIVSESQN